MTHQSALALRSETAGRATEAGSRGEPLPGHGHPHAGWSDAHLCDTVAEQIARPKIAPADSFILHAPLELLARKALLPLVHPAARERARRRIARLGETYRDAGPELAEPHAVAYDRVGDGLAHLVAAIDVGDLDGADADAAWLAAALPPAELPRALADDVLPRLAAAAHGSIFLYHLPRVAPWSRATARALRGLVRELAREHDWKLHWHRDPERTPAPASHPADSTAARASAELFARLRRPPYPGDPGSNFIYPTMSIVERSGLASELLDEPTRALDVASARRVLSRIAALSMLQDDPDQAPYGWSHCLSMPQATLGIADRTSDPAAAIAVAATYVLGFRATLGKVGLDGDWQPAPPAVAPSSAGDLRGLLDAPPREAAATAWHVPDELEPSLVAELATRAAIHHDAHLAKYTVACFDAAAAEPGERRLYLAAAAFLSAWWAQQPSDDGALDD